MIALFMDNKEREISSKELRTFGLLMGGMIALFFGLLIPLIWGLALPLLPWVIAVAFAIWALAAPATLSPIYRGWMKVASVLAWINTRLILGIAFYIVILPTGLILRSIRKDPLNRTIDQAVQSYRINKKQRVKNHMERPY